MKMLDLPIYPSTKLLNTLSQDSASYTRYSSCIMYSHSGRMRQASEIREMFDTIAVRYDRANRWLSLGLDLWWRRVMVQSLPIETDAAVLDVFTGSGDSILCFKRSLRLLVGLDFSQPMLTLAYHKARRRDVAVVWIKGDALRLPFRANTFTP